MTRRFWFLSYVIFGLIFLGLVTRNGRILAVAIPLVVYVSAAILYAPEEIRLKAARSISQETITPRKTVQVKIQIENAGPGIEELFVEDELFASVQRIEGPVNARLIFPGESQFEFNYSLKANRGSYFYRSLVGTASDPFDLIEKRFELEAPGKFLVLPEAAKIRSIPIRPQQTRGFAGPIPARQGGSGINFWGVREYQMGDPLRWINWRVSARHFQDVFTNEFEQERIADVGIILDARVQNEVRVGREILFEHAVLAAASLADSFLRDGNRVSLLIYGFGVGRVYPGFGKHQLNRILSALALAQPGQNFALESLNNLPTQMFPSRSQLVMISPLAAGDIPVLIRLRSHGYEVLVISPDAVAFEAKVHPKGPVLNYAERMARIERNIYLQRLLKVGVRVVEWPVDQSLDVVIQKAVGMLPLRNPHFRVMG
jgi:uncharacterized protein (DUF58 family)